MDKQETPSQGYRWGLLLILLATSFLHHQSGAVTPGSSVRRPRLPNDFRGPKDDLLELESPLRTVPVAESLLKGHRNPIFTINATHPSKQRRDLRVDSRSGSSAACGLAMLCPSPYLRGSTRNLRFNITAAVKYVYSTAVTINLNVSTEVVSNINRASSIQKPIQIQLTHRMFGNLESEERIVLIDKNLRTTDAMLPRRNFFTDEVSVHNLYPDSGYVFCFSLMTPGGTSLQVNQEKEMIGASVVSSDHHPLRSDVTKSQQADRFSEGVVIPPFHLPVPRRNYAYSSTGKLIYIPSSSWNPQFRSKRRTEKSELKQHCLEIKTLSEQRNIFTPLFVLCVLLSFIFGLIMVLIVGFLWKSSCFKANALKCIKRGKGKQHWGSSNKADKMERKQADLSGGMCTQEEPFNAHSSAPKILSKKCSDGLISSGDTFHPGYELPPSSTVEVYGYNAPKTYKSVEGPVSSTPSSCEMNNHVSEGMWDSISTKRNLDIPLCRHKHSEVNKSINTFGEICLTPSISQSQLQRTDGIYARLKYPLLFNEEPAIHKTNTNYNIKPLCEYQSRKALESQLETPCQNFNVNITDEFRSFSPCSGDVTITGGTLIEVPEGYVVPRASPHPVSPSVLQIIVPGNDVASTSA